MVFHTCPVSDSRRGVAIYIRDTIKADYCYSLNKTKESVWCEIVVNRTEKLLIGWVYKSPNCDAENHTLLNRLVSEAVEMGYKHTVIVGDFNFPEINWESWIVSRSESHPAFHFVECIRDNYLFQHVHSNTRYRDGQNPSCLDLVLTDKEELIENLRLGDMLGASNEVSLIFDVNCEFEKVEINQQRPNFYKADYRNIRNYLNQVDWSDMTDLNTEES